MCISLLLPPKGCSVHDGRTQIEQDQARQLLIIAQDIESFGAVRHTIDTVALDLSVVRDKVDHSLFVLDNQEVACSHSTALSLAPLFPCHSSRSFRPSR
jgi:hypothetical protein